MRSSFQGAWPDDIATAFQSDRHPRVITLPRPHAPPSVHTIITSVFHEYDSYRCGGVGGGCLLTVCIHGNATIGPAPRA